MDKTAEQLAQDVKDLLQPYIYQTMRRVEELELRVAQLEARPQPAQPIGGAGNFDYNLMTKAGGWAFPWGTRTAASVGEIMAGQQYTTSVTGDNVSRETSKGPNGSTGKTPPDMA